MAAGTAVKAPAEYRFTVNGEEQVVTCDKPLLRYLRDDLKLTSVKDGCSEGACGTCTVLVDDRATKACVLTTRLANGRDIVTVEGLPHEEQEAFVYAFGAVGAVQCGFCIPGMVMAGAALIHKVPDPTEDQVKVAIRGNVCRCTGYKKIIEGILLAAAILRGEKDIDPELERGDDYGVGKRAFRVDVRRKVLGYGKYPDDIDERDFPDLTYASAVRSKYPRARVVKIDAEKARAMPGVLAVLTAADVPVNAVGHLLYDWDVMTAEGDVTHCVGDAIALVVAEDAATLAQAKKAVKVEYEVLEPVRSIEEARRPGAPVLHKPYLAFGNWVTPENNICQQRHVVRGDAAAALAGAAHKVTRTFKTPFTEHAFLEPECAVAFPYKGGVKVCSSDQGAYDSRKEIAHMLGWDATPERVVVETMLVGGGFGGKEDVSVQHLAALAALAVNRPVKVRLTRQESINFHPKRHYMEGTFTLGCDEDGTFVGLDCEINFDTGAYASLCGPVLERVLLPEHRHPRLWLVHQQPARRRVPRLRRLPERVRAGEPHRPPGRRGGHLPVGDSLPQRHRARQGPAQRPDRRPLHRPQGDPARGQGRLRGAPRPRRPRVRDEERGRGRGPARRRPLQDSRGGRPRGGLLRHLRHRPGLQHRLPAGRG